MICEESGHHEHWNGCHHLLMVNEKPCICGKSSDGTYCCTCGREFSL